jgi:hypothetical protein
MQIPFPSTEREESEEQYVAIIGVLLDWVMGKGVEPIPTTKKKRGLLNCS